MPVRLDDILSGNVGAESVVTPGYRSEWLRKRHRDICRSVQLVERQPFIPHTPTRKQAAFLAFPQREALYGGAAGGGKSDALLMAALQYAHVPGYTSLLLRKSYKDLALPGALIDRAKQWLTPHEEVHWDSTKKTFTFPSGARLVFGYLASQSDVYQYQSSAFQFVGFDELTQFSEFQYTYLFSRVRRPSLPCANCGLPLDTETVETDAIGSDTYRHKDPEDAAQAGCSDPSPDPQTTSEYPRTAGGLSVFNVPLRVRAATNPGGKGHKWVKRRYLTDPDPRDQRPFVPALIKDNPYLDREEYKESLSNLDPVTREQLLRGDWEARATGGMFDRAWFDVLPERPRNKDITWVRFWDLAGSKPTPNYPDPDYTVGVLMGRDRTTGMFNIADVRRVRRSPLQVQRLVRRTAQMDGRSVRVVIEKEGGASGKMSIDTFQRKILPGHEVFGRSPTGNKFVRAKPVSAQAEAGNIVICNPSRWNLSEYFDELESFTRTSDGHDDQVDATSGALHELTSKLHERDSYKPAQM